jgi:hypothetical protein
LHDGQADARKLNYVPLPETVVKRIEASWSVNLKAWP